MTKRLLALVAPIAAATSFALADEVVYNCALNAAASTLTQATDVNAPFAGTLKGNYDVTTNPTGTQTIPGFFGGSGNNPIPYTASFVLAGDIVSHPTGALVVGTDIEALQVRVSGLNIDLLGGVPGVLGSTLNINYQTFRTVAPSGFFPGGVTVPIPLGNGSISQWRATQTGPVVAGPLLPQKNGTFTFAVAVPVDFSVVATLLDQPVSDGTPTPGVLPLNGTLTVNEANNTVALSVAIANQSTTTQPVTTGQFTDLPLAIPTVIPAGGTANLLMSGAVTQVTLATNLTAALAIAGTRAPTPGDLNGDFRVNSMDITICLSNWGASTLGDTNGDGVTDSRDITVILSNWQ
jgi:hypothetical protein